MTIKFQQRRKRSIRARRVVPTAAIATTDMCVESGIKCE